MVIRTTQNWTTLLYSIWLTLIVLIYFTGFNGCTEKLLICKSHQDWCHSLYCIFIKMCNVGNMVAFFMQLTQHFALYDFYLIHL